MMTRRLPMGFDDLQVLAMTVAMEAANQSEKGRLGVAWAIINRAMAAGLSLPDVVFRKAQFSSWMTGSPTLLWVDTLPEATWYGCLKAACAAYFGLLPDPTGGAQHYLNPTETMEGRSRQGLGYTLPEWAHAPGHPEALDERRVTLREGDHVWLKLT